ncbi:MULTISPECIES: hypothetical protein [unclassified Streptomyces]|nr:MULTISPECIES: hypothetical protein [unclassified Streptomyces]MCO6715344.1 hypothetical protein [Streptomyces sp. CHB19.2]MCO6739043.1 hypothetical protein [Streptomyces sp. CHA15]MCO6727136.1 hypothetical protein [Streptomyces sp. CHA16]MCO6762041.1 hypothetical protein [Streptomyces sp. EL5]UUD70320.1 hypothetical protein KNZ81_23355 [Streptomyces sp. G11C(2021)]
MGVPVLPVRKAGAAGKYTTAMSAKPGTTDDADTGRRLRAVPTCPNQG